MIAALIRHGEYHQPPGVPSAHLPHPLTPEGESQARRGAELVAEHLQRAGWHLAPRVHCSMMLRAWQTATIMAEILGERLGVQLEVCECPELAERCVGAVANLTVTQIEEVLAADPRYEVPNEGWKRDSHYRLPFQGCESLLEAGQRVALHIRSTLPDAPGCVRLYFGHGGAFRHAAHALGVLPFASLEKLSMHHATPVFLQGSGAQWQVAAGAFKQRRARAEAD